MSGTHEVTADYVMSWSRRAHGSPLYQALGAFIAEDPDLMRVIQRIEHWPPTNLLFGGVHFLLIRGAQSPLRDHYPSLVADPLLPDGSEQLFKDFVLDNEEWLVATGNTRYTQTNEVKRCTALLPAVWATGLESFHLLEVGASAGLNLAMDLYHYRWGETQWGPAESSVHLETVVRRGAVQPGPIEVLSRTGLDLNPIDPDDPDERDWLLALIWPEHLERRDRLERALAMRRSTAIEMVAGDASESFAQVVAGLPPGEPVLVMNSMVLSQFSRAQRESLYGSIDEIARSRTLRRVSFEFLAAGDEWVTVSADGGRGLAQIGQAHPHAEWIELYARP